MWIWGCLFKDGSLRQFYILTQYSQFITMTLVQFRAGKVEFNEETDVYTPSPVRGDITIRASEEGEGFYNFEWTPTEAPIEQAMEKDELLIFAGDVTWKKVNSCKTGRVYALTFSSSGSRTLYWMQTKNDESEDEVTDPNYLSKESAADVKNRTKIEQLLSETI